MDYVSISVPLTFSPLGARQCVPLRVLNDDIDEDNEMLVVTLQQGTVVLAMTSVEIIDDGTCATVNEPQPPVCCFLCFFESCFFAVASECRMLYTPLCIIEQVFDNGVYDAQSIIIMYMYVHVHCFFQSRFCAVAKSAVRAVAVVFLNLFYSYRNLDAY